VNVLTTLVHSKAKNEAFHKQQKLRLVTGGLEVSPPPTVS
jgi:hypothetical protein